VKLSLLLLACMLLGALTGRLVGAQAEPPAFVTDLLLYALMVCVGVDLGVSLRRDGFKRLWRALRGSAVSVCSTVTGSLLGGLLAGVLTGLGLGRGLAVAAGFGWYTLSGVLLAELDGPLLGGAAFLANLFREALALLLIPPLLRRGQSAAAVSSAGATSMDTTMGLLAQGGPETAAAGFVHGLILTLLTPLLIPLLYGLAA
jgi:uncharacterized membrane protein YbjE (DUF340 family)